MGQDTSNKKKNEREQFGYKIFERKIPSKQISIFLSSVIGDPIEYVEMVNKIKQATENDVIYIYLNTPGGNLETGVQIINAIRNTPAHVVVSLESTAHSLGTLIFLSGDELQIHDHCLMMFHNFSAGMYGKGHELTAELEAVNKWYNKMFRKICVPFLTAEEIEQVIDGRDLWLETDEIKRRLNRMTKEEEIEKKPKRTRR